MKRMMNLMLLIALLLTMTACGSAEPLCPRRNLPEKPFSLPQMRAPAYRRPAAIS